MSFVLTDTQIYNRAATYSGAAEICVFEFSLGPEQIPGTGWFANVVIDAFKNELEENHGEMLELRVYRDIQPTWETLFAVEAIVGTSQLQPAGVVSPQLIFALSWALIIKALLILMGIFAVILAGTFLIKSVQVLLYGPPDGNGNGGGGGLLGGTLGAILPVILIAVMIPMMSRFGSAEK